MHSHPLFQAISLITSCAKYCHFLNSPDGTVHGLYRDPFVRKLKLFSFFPGRKLPGSARVEKERGTPGCTRYPMIMFDLIMFPKACSPSLAQAQKHACMWSGFQALCCTYTDHQSVKKSIVTSTDWGTVPYLTLPPKVTPAYSFMDS